MPVADAGDTRLPSKETAMSLPALHQLTEMSTLDAIYERRAIRAYTGERVDHETLNDLLRAAVQAPTAIHEEPWVFAVVQNRELLALISERAKALWPTEAAARHDAASLPRASDFAQLLAQPDFNIFYDAGTLVVIGALPLGPFAAADCWLAAENLMLAACALGLGTCCIGSAVVALSTP